MIPTYKQALAEFFKPLTSYRLFGEQETAQPYWLYRKENLEENGVIKFIDAVDISSLPDDVACLVIGIRDLKQNIRSMPSGSSSETRETLALLRQNNSNLSAYANSLWLSLSLRDSNKAVRKTALECLSQHYNEYIEMCFVDFSYANFTELEQDRAKFDFNGHYLVGANFSENLTLKGTKFKYACLSKTNFQGARLSFAFFEGAWLDNVTFTASTLDGANFQYAQGLLEKSLDSARSKTGIYLSDPRLATATQTISDQIHQAAIHYTEAEESIGISAASPNWPKEPSRWQHEDQWNGEALEQRDSQLCELSSNDELYRLISHMVYITGDYVSVRDAWLFNNQVVGALESKSMKDFLYAINNTPEHPGFVGSITINSIQVVHNPTLWKQYQDKKAFIMRELNGESTTLTSTHFPWHRSALQPLPIIDKKVGECLLFHGVRNPDVMPWIIQGGFTTKFMKTSKRGWGELGKGIYLGEEFSKSATYVRCPECKVSPCRCAQKPTRQIFLTRALLGCVKEDRYHENRWNEVGSRKYHSSWGPAPEVTASEFKHNEFAVPPEQVYPEFIITYQENPKEFTLQANSFMPSAKDWQERLSRGKLDKSGSELIHISHLLENYHRLLCYRKEDAWSLQTQLHFMQQMIQSVQHALSANFDEKELAGELESNIQQEAQRLGLISTALLDTKKEQGEDALQQYQQGLYHYQQHNFAKALPHIQKLIQLQPEEVRYKLLLAKVYYHLGIFYQQPLVEAMHQALLQNKDLSWEWLNNSNILSVELYYQTSLELIAKNKDISSNSQNNQTWVQDVLHWHAEQTLNNTSKQREVYDALPELLRQEFVAILLMLIPKTHDNRLRRNFIYSWPDVSGMRPLTRAQKIDWLQTIEQVLTQAKNPTGVRLHWLVETQNDMIINEAYLNKVYIQSLFDAAGELIPNEPEQDESIQQGRCLVKALCNAQNEPIAYIKFYPKYPLRQQFADELCFRLSGHGAITTLAFIIHEKTKAIYPVLISQPLGIAPNPKEPKQRHLLAWEFLDRDSQIESRLDKALFTWKVFETYLLQPKDEKNDNLFPFLNPHTQNYGLISGDADRILSQTPMKGETVLLNSNIFLMDAMRETLEPAVVKHFLSLDIKTLLDGVIEYFKKLQLQLSALQQRYHFSFELFEEGMPRHIGKQTIDTDSHLLRLFRDEDLPELYQRFMFLHQTLRKSDIKGPMTHLELITDLMPHCARAYQAASESQPQLKTSSPRFLLLNNKYQRQTKSVQVESPGGKGTVTRTTTYSKTEAPEKIGLGFLKTTIKETLLTIQRISTQAELLHNTQFIYSHLSDIIQAIYTAQTLDKFKQAPSDFIREIVWNQLDWRKLNLPVQRDLLMFLPRFKCQRLRLAHCSVTEKQLLQHLDNNKNLAELYLIDCVNLSATILGPVSKMVNLKRLVIVDMRWRGIQTKEAGWFTKGSFPVLRELKIKNCASLVDFEFYSSQLQFLALINCPELILTRAMLERYKTTLVKLWIDTIKIENNQLSKINFDQLRWLECHQSDLQIIDITAPMLDKLVLLAEHIISAITVPEITAVKIVPYQNQGRFFQLLPVTPEEKQKMQLFQETLWGDIVVVRKLLQQNPELASMYSDITDLGNRKFKNITTFQYSVWSKDDLMWEVHLEFMNIEEAARQFEELKNREDIINDYGQYYSLQPLITSHLELEENWEQWNIEQRYAHFSTNIGGAQFTVPAWYIYAICEPGLDVAWTKQDMDRQVKRTEKDQVKYKWKEGGVRNVHLRAEREIPVDKLSMKNKARELVFYFVSFKQEQMMDRRVTQAFQARQTEKLEKLQARLAKRASNPQGEPVNNINTGITNGL